MISLEVYQGERFSRVLQAYDRGGSQPLYFLEADVTSGAVWDGQTQAVLFTPAVSWFTGLGRIDVVTGGTGYVQESTSVVISGGDATVDASAIATVIGGQVVEITIANPGSGYTSAPTVAVFGVGTGASALATPAFGYRTGQILVEMTAAQTAGLETMGQYRFRARATRDVSVPLIDCLIRVFPSPGTATRTILTYCGYQDLLNIAPWIAGVQDVDTDQEGFYSQRLKARLWLDDIILNRFQGGYTGSYGAHSNDFGGSRGGLGPDTAIKGYLTDNKLMRTPAIVEVCSHYAVSQVGLGQLGSGGGMSLAHRGAWHLSKAQRDVLAITVQIDTNDDGTGDMFANLSTISATYG